MSGLAVALYLKRLNGENIAPVITADTYFVVGCMKNQSGSRNGARDVCVMVIGTSAKSDVVAVYPSAAAFANYSSWAGSSGNGFIDAAVGTTQAENYAIARDQGVAAYNAGF